MILEAIRSTDGVSRVIAEHALTCVKLPVVFRPGPNGATGSPGLFRIIRSLIASVTPTIIGGVTIDVEGYLSAITDKEFLD